MTEDQREIRRKKRVLEYAEKLGNINTTCRRFGIARSTFYLRRDRYRENQKRIDVLLESDYLHVALSRLEFLMAAMVPGLSAIDRSAASGDNACG